MKTLSELWKEFDKKKGKLTQEGIEDLKWHIENDVCPYDAISAAIDMMHESPSPETFMSVLVPPLVKYLDSENEFVRGFSAMRVFFLLELSEYGEKALHMALHDPEAYARNSALCGFGRIINKVDKKLAKEMTLCLYNILTSKDFEKYNTHSRGCASDSIVEVMGVTNPKKNMTFDDIWKSFLKKYNLPEKEVVKVERGW